MTEHNLKIPEVSRGRRSAEQQARYDAELKSFADGLLELQYEIAGTKIISESNKISARGWCYQLEGFNLITKNQFDLCFNLINTCRKEGLLPIDFTAQDSSREFYNVEDLKMEYEEPRNWLNSYLRWIKKAEEAKKDVAFWESQKYYLQMITEKIDVRNLFHDICRKYHIPIANAKGWSDLNMRANLVNRFKEAEEIGLKPVLLYFGDFDPAGIKIVETIKKNIDDISKATLYTADNLIVDHFGLSIDFINKNNITWIDNLITGGDRKLGELYKAKKFDKLYDYEIQYIQQYGVRKCEANAIMPKRKEAIADFEKVIHKYLGDNPFEVYDAKIKERQDEVLKIMENVDYKKRIAELIDDIKNK